MEFRDAPCASQFAAELVPRLLAAFGTRPERFATADDLQAYSGIAPVTERSGKHEMVRFRWACPKFLRQTFHEFAAFFDP